MMFEEEKRYDGATASNAYFSSFGNSSYFEFRHNPRVQRLVKCKECGVKIPREIPRIYLSGSFNYSKGHYCLKCAITLMNYTLESRKELLRRVKRDIDNLNRLIAFCENTSEKSEYKDAMSVAYMLAKLEGRRRDW